MVGPKLHTEQAQIHILIIDDHPIVRQALKHLLEEEPERQISVDVSEGNEALNAIIAFPPDLVLLDLALKTGDGLSLTRSIRAQYPNLPILMLSLHNEALFAERALRAGASGYIMKSESPEKLLDAIRHVLHGGIYLSRAMRQSILHKIKGDAVNKDAHAIDRLSDRELEVFQLIGQGYSTHQIADMLELSVKTIETHRAHIKKKLDFPNNTVLINSAAQWVMEDKLV